MKIALFNMTTEDNFINLCNLTTSVLGLPKDSLSLKSRKQDLQVARSIAGVIARTEDDIHQTVIAKVLNRDRSLIYHYEKMHKDNYATFPKYRNAFNKVYIAYKDINSAKKTFLDSDFMKSHLLKNDVKEHLKAQVLIEVKSGESMCIVKTSYFDFSNQLENVKLAMSNYHYSVKIL
jgi:hypothetical protein